MLKELIQDGYGIKEDLNCADTILCEPLKNNYRTEEKKCIDVILKAAEILDKIVTRKLKNLSKNK